MKSIKVTVLDRQFPLKVNQGDEEHMNEIAGFVDRRFRDFRRVLEKQSDSTVMTLAALSIAEDYFLEKNKTGTADSTEEIMNVINSSLEEILADIKRRNNDLG